jgi:hypothetical protein
MTSEEKFSILTQLYIQLRRNAGRVIDVAWASVNDEYLREVIRVARSASDVTLDKLADRLEQLSGNVSRMRAPMTETSMESGSSPNQYVGKLR